MNTTFKKSVEIIGGGTVSHVRSHLALSAPAYGTTAKKTRTKQEVQYERHRSYKGFEKDGQGNRKRYRNDQ